MIIDKWPASCKPATDYPDLEFVIAKSSGTLIGREALERESGARGLLAIMESIMVDLM